LRRKCAERRGLFERDQRGGLRHDWGSHFVDLFFSEQLLWKWRRDGNGYERRRNRGEQWRRDQHERLRHRGRYRGHGWRHGFYRPGHRLYRSEHGLDRHWLQRGQHRLEWTQHVKQQYRGSLTDLPGLRSATIRVPNVPCVYRLQGPQ
jgi:hypothetical protein